MPVAGEATFGPGAAVIGVNAFMSKELPSKKAGFFLPGGEKIRLN